MTKILYEKESYLIVQACIEVHKELGCGFLEPVYQEALALEFANLLIPFERERSLEIFFKGIKLGKNYKADFICYNKIILELKAVKNILGEHEAQVLNYLNATGYKLGMIVNFGENSFKFKRLIK